MNPRDCGKLLSRLEDLMEEHKKESALKTHIGVSIDVFRYYAGWCDKLQGLTIPINKCQTK